MKKKGCWHCGRCNRPCLIAKHGKHRFLLCPEHQIIALNPIPLIAGGLALASKYIPKAIAGITKSQPSLSTDERRSYTYIPKVREPVLVDID